MSTYIHHAELVRIRLIFFFFPQWNVSGCISNGSLEVRFTPKTLYCLTNKTVFVSQGCSIPADLSMYPSNPKREQHYLTNLVWITSLFIPLNFQYQQLLHTEGLTHT